MSNNCSNCYNGCTEITSDKCVKYTGVDVPVLGIKNGDSLSYVEQSIIGFLSSTLDGTGILPVITPSDVCPSVENHLPNCDPISLNNWLTALLKALCDLENTVSEIPDVNPPTSYDVDCLTPSDSSSTIDVLQSVIYKVCDVAEQLNNFITYVDATYVKISDINTYIQNYLDTSVSEQLINKRMVPYSIVAAAGTAILSNFDASGAGIGDWDRIFLCNGENGTPDLRGRVLVGTNDGSMGGGTMDSAVDPAITTNPQYGIGSVHGSNSVVLTEGQIPAHTHSNTVSTEADHVHGFPYPVVMNPSAGGDSGGTLSTSDNLRTEYTSQTGPGGEHTHTVTINETGGGQGHPNFQPGRGVFYIIYIP
jgi:microcystin-dependent protein